MMVRRIVDICMTVLLLCLMAYQVTGEEAHEWIGIVLTVLVIVHQILNRKWYGAIFKGKYNAYRTLVTAVAVLLLISFALTAFSGMSMSGYAVPFLYGMVKVSFARRMHLSMSHWSFILMGLHLGLHVPVMTARWKLSDQKKNLISAAFCCAAGFGLFFFLRNGMPDYLFFRMHFAFLDYDQSPFLVFAENLAMMVFWAFLGAQGASLCRKVHEGQADMKSYNLGVRLVRNAGNDRSGTVAVKESVAVKQPGGKVLIAYFSWGGNTRGIAREIQEQTGADLFEIVPAKPYSEDYNTVLMEAQEDQHKQARPELSGHVDNMEDYGTILLGHPNWWASIPEDVSSWLDANGIKR